MQFNRFLLLDYVSLKSFFALLGLILGQTATATTDGGIFVIWLADWIGVISRRV